MNAIYAYTSDCGPPKQIKYGVVTAFTGRYLGDVAMYECQGVRMMLGDVNSTCQETGEWSTVPSCVPSSRR